MIRRAAWPDLMTRLKPAAGSRGGPSRWTTGQRVIALYFVIAYVVPATGQAIFGEQVVSTYWKYPVTLYSLLQVVIVFGLFVLMSRTVLRAKSARPRMKMLRLVSRGATVYEYARLPFAIGALTLAFIYYSSGYNGYRYGETGVSQSGSWLLLLVNTVNAMISVDLYNQLFIVRKPRVRFGPHHIGSLLLAIAYLVSASGAFLVFIGMSAILFAVSPGAFRNLISSAKELSLFKRIRRSAVRGVVVLALFSTAWLAGEGIKASSTRVVTVIEGARYAASDIVSGEGWLRNYFYYLIERSSIYYYSLVYTASYMGDVSAVGGVAPVLLPLRTVAFRADFLLGSPFGVDKPEVPSSMRFNYLVLAIDERRFPRGGSAPGVIGAVNYVVSFPLNVLICGAYLAWVARMIDVLLWRHRNQVMGLIGILLLYMFSEAFLQSPFDLLNVIDGAGIQVVSLLVLYRASRLSWGLHDAAAMSAHDTPPAPARRLGRRLVSSAVVNPRSVEA